ncbi:hypothetical protein B4135_1053 [Caldibacillus debilis]|uniref:Uncharacterized protein n=1 Tax=Caldibacillus debilis TaxID=301148 RepID=A0A150ME57_9BACI|nr:hypothetical protein B4135_1053 [Caldibacillus debilis]
MAGLKPGRTIRRRFFRTRRKRHPRIPAYFPSVPGKSVPGGITAGPAGNALRKTDTDQEKERNKGSGDG